MDMERDTADRGDMLHGSKSERSELLLPELQRSWGDFSSDVCGHPEAKGAQI